jgi:hypothetical protein
MDPHLKHSSSYCGRLPKRSFLNETKFISLWIGQPNPDRARLIERGLIHSVCAKSHQTLRVGLDIGDVEIEVKAILGRLGLWHSLQNYLGASRGGINDGVIDGVGIRVSLNIGNSWYISQGRHPEFGHDFKIADVDPDLDDDFWLITSRSGHLRYLATWCR